MKKALLFLFSSFIFLPGIKGQSGSANVDAGYGFHCRLAELAAGENTDGNNKNINEIKLVMDSALALFGSLPVDADYSVKQLCSYYSAVSKFYFGQALYNASLSDSSYQVLKSLENDFVKIHAAIYPIDCNTGESFYRIYRSDFEPINADYNLLMGLLTQQNDNTPGHHIALKYFNNVMINDYASPWAKYRSADFIMRNSLQTSGYKPEAAPAIIDFIKASCWLDESAMQKASGLNYENALNGLQALDSIYKAYPADAARDSNYASIVKSLYDAGYIAEAIRIAEVVMASNYTNFDFNYNCMRMAINEYKSDFAKASAIKATEYRPDTSCNYSYLIADAYALSGDAINSDKNYNLYLDCFREDQAQQPQPKGHYFNFYTGLYLSGFFDKPSSWDYGLSTALVLKRIGFEFTYLQVSNRPEIYVADGSSLDWSGNKIRSQFMMMNIGEKKKDNVFYVGLIFGIGNKNYGTYKTVVKERGGSSFNYKCKGMKEKQYELMFNFGRMILRKNFGGDLSFAFGMSYNVFDDSTAPVYYNNPDYIIDDDFFYKREKNYVTIQAVIRLSLGYNLGGRRGY